MQKQEATLTLSLTALLSIIAFIAVGMGVFGLNIAVLLFLSWIIVWPIASRMGYNFADLEKFAYDMAAKSIAPSAIILAVGMMIAAFMASGTVPTILVLGLEHISPKFFLATAFLSCAAMSVLTGTSWGTLGTIGVAMMGCGVGLNVNPAMTAGAIVCGAWFGDKMSPVSDSTILCSTIAGSDLMDHIKAMMQTTIPAAIITVILYAGIGIATTGGTSHFETTMKIVSGLEGMFHISWITLLPVVLVVGMFICKQGTIISLLVGIISATVIAILYQGYSVSELGKYLYSGFGGHSTNDVVNSIVQRGGMTTLLSLIAVFIGGLGLGGMLHGTGLLKPIFDKVIERSQSPRSIMKATWVATLLCILVIADNNFTFVMVGTLFAGIYKRMGIKPQMLSRVLEDVGTLGSALIPWNVGAIFAAGILGVSTLDYLPYAFLNWLTPLISLVFILYQYRIQCFDTEPKAQETF